MSQLRSEDVKELLRKNNLRVEDPAPRTEETEFEIPNDASVTINKEVETSIEKSQNQRTKNFTDLDKENILNSEEGVQTRSRTKNRASSCLLAFQSKVETYSLPNSYLEFIGRSDQQHWEQAYDKEIKKLTDIGKMQITEKPKDKQVIPILELFSRKEDSLIRENIFKCRFVARGDLEQCDEIRNLYSPVCSVEVTRVFVALCAHYKATLRQADVTSAFLYGKLNRRIFVELPEKLKRKHGNDYCWSTTRSLYGLNDAPLAWHKRIKQTFLNIGFNSCPIEPALFYYNEGNTKTFMLCYVDDLLYFGTNESHLDEVEKKLKKSFELKSSKRASKFIGLEIVQNSEEIILSQTNYVKDLLQDFEMTEAKVFKTPIEPMSVPNNDGVKLPNPKLFQALLGSINYLTNSTRPDLSFAANQMSRFNQTPTFTNLKQLKRILRFLKYVPKKYLIFRKASLDLRIEAFVDSEHGEHENGKSVFGYIILMNGSPVLYKTKQQDSTSLSSTESEFKSFTDVAKKILYLKNLLEFMEIEVSDWKLYNDNQSAIKMAYSSTSVKRTKHIKLKYFYIRECLENDEFKLLYVPTDENLADGFTKGLRRIKFEKFSKKIFK